MSKQPKYRDFSDWRRRAPLDLFDPERPAALIFERLAYLGEGEKYARTSTHWLALVEDHLRFGLRACDSWPYLRKGVSVARRLSELDELAQDARKVLQAHPDALKALETMVAERRSHGSLPILEAVLETWAYNMDHMNRTALNTHPWKYERRVSKVHGAPASGKSKAILDACAIRSHEARFFEASLLTPEGLGEAIAQVYKSSQQHQKSVQGVIVIERAEHLSPATMKAIEDYLKGGLAPNRPDKLFPDRPWVELVLEYNAGNL